MSGQYKGDCLPGNPTPLGASYDGSGVNFAVFSENATGVTLSLFFPVEGTIKEERITISSVTDNVWHIYLPGIKPGQLYGYRVGGSYDPSVGHRFNEAKLLLDPYAKAIDGRIDIRENMFDYNINELERNANFVKSDSDSADVLNKSVVLDPHFDWQGVMKPQVPLEKTIIYELNVKGFTAMHPDISQDERGTFKGLANEKVIDYFKSLGVTSIELMPVHHFVHNKFLLDLGLTNYWGYDTVGFFAPHAAYSSSATRGNQVDEFKEMVRAYHRHGMEIILDVVYNHSGETNEKGPTIAFRGLDNAVYYRLKPGELQKCDDVTGTGNTLNMEHPVVMQLVMDSLRYWTEEMQVDGFRFDLATTLTRGANGKVMTSEFLEQIKNDPVISTQKLIAEPWDLGRDGYQLGKFPCKWLEWNGKFRDSVRKFWRGDEKQFSEFANRITGSTDLSDCEKGEKYFVNFTTAHDGFTLHDLVSYNRKYNMSNGEQNKDGDSHNHSWNSGAEGETDQFEVLALREKRKRSFLATLLLSRGVPMISHGDEYGRTQKGNNNAYCQDNEITWMDWDLSDDQKWQLKFFQKLVQLRNEFSFFTSGDVDYSAIRWIHPEGRELAEADLKDQYLRCAGMLIEDKAKGTALILYNSFWDTVPFRLPKEETSWEIVIDTENVENANAVINRNTILLQQRALMVLIRNQ